MIIINNSQDHLIVLPENFNLRGWLKTSNTHGIAVNVPLHQSVTNLVE